MDITLRIISRDLDTKDLQELTRDLSHTLRDEAGVITNLPEESPGPGNKGEPVTLGTIILTALTSGTVVAFFHVVKSYFERRHSLEMELQRSDGKTFTVHAENLNKAQIENTIRLAKIFFGG